MDCLIDSIEVLFLTMVMREIMGEKFSICPNNKSSWATFWAAVLRLGTSSASSWKSQRGFALVFFNRVVLGRRNVAKLASKDKVYSRFCLKLSNEVINLLRVRLHCLGALLVAILMEKVC